MDKKFLVFLGTNGSVNVVPEDRPSPIAPAVFLVIVFALGLGLNVFLASSISPGAFPRTAFNLLILHLALVCALDSVNILGSLVVLLHASPGLVFCRLDAMTSQLTTILQSWLVAALSAERAVTRSSEPLDEGTSRRAALEQTAKRVLPAVLWFYATALILPIGLVLQAADILVFTDRYSCGCADLDSSILYPAILLVLGHVIPWMVAGTSLTSLARYESNTRSHHRKLAQAAEHRRVLTLTGSYLPREGFGAKKARCAEEDKFDVILTVVIFVYVLLLLPNILSVSISQFTMSVKRTEAVDNSSASKDVTHTSTGTYDVVFIWLRYSVTILVPLTLFLMHKEVRKKCEALFCCLCHVENSVLDFEELKAVSAERTVGKGVKTSKKKTKGSRIAHHRTPVLYATSGGLHLRLYEEDEENDVEDGGAERLSWLSEGRSRGQGPKYTCEFCDLVEFSAPVTQTLAPHKQQVNTYAVIEHEEASHSQRRLNHSQAFRRSDAALAGDAAQQNKKIVRFGEVQSINDTFKVERPGTSDANASRRKGDSSSR